MVTIKTEKEIKILAEGGKRLAFVMNELASKIEPGLSTVALDDLARKLVKKQGGKPSFLAYAPEGAKTPYPSSVCVSINNEVVHGIPDGKKILKEGDIVSLDLGMEYKKLYTDMAVTAGVGEISPLAKKIIKVTKQSLSKGISVLKDGAKAGDYGFIVQSFIKKSGFSVVRKLVGHGVGYGVHEPPDIPNWGVKGAGFEFKTGMVLALEPMVCEGGADVLLEKDGWTWKTKDGLISAHFEQTVVIEKDGCKVLTK
jgi:methionyl aminopeptidase